eukprot:TRINITY_DN1806_c0_g3_i1.p1 TRINITY_DN1806_c0_g3~~TRINITY_DN1806_c0_g3_i1.p1  ORF type:complete len:442 (+),score=61.70 TRINITY_DN1806_c0_g3_i1:169-1326(+)
MNVTATAATTRTVLASVTSAAARLFPSSFAQPRGLREMLMPGFDFQGAFWLTPTSASASVSWTFVSGDSGRTNAVGFFLYSGNLNCFTCPTCPCDTPLAYEYWLFPSTALSPNGTTVTVSGMEAGQLMGSWVIRDGYSDKFWAQTPQNPLLFSSAASLLYCTWSSFYNSTCLSPSETMAHHLLVREVRTGTLFLAIEDTIQSGTDFDYNDNVYMITATGSLNETFIVRYLAVSCIGTNGAACRFGIDNGGWLVSAATITTANSAGTLYSVTATGQRSTACVSCTGGSLTLNSRWQLEFYPPVGTGTQLGFTTIILSVRESAVTYTEFIRIDTYSSTGLTAPTSVSQSVSMITGQTILITLGGSDNVNSELTATIMSIPAVGTLQQ